MNARAVALAAACAAGAASAEAQAARARCDLRPGHVFVSRAIQDLRGATETAFQDERERDLRDAHQQLVETLVNAGQPDNAAAWYYLGRYYVVTNDLAGADSAFREVVALVPACLDDVNTWRRVLWVPIMNAGVAVWLAGNPDSAITVFRTANAVYAAEPTAFSYLATLFARRDQVDSAATYFRLARDAAADPRFAADRKTAEFNLAGVYHRAGRYEEAVRAYQAYLEEHPADLGARAGLVAVYLRTGHGDAATQGVAVLLADTDSAAAGDLLVAGETIRRAVPAPPAAALVAAACRAVAPADTLATLARCDSTERTVRRAYETMRAADCRLALAVLRAGLAKNPYDRAALFTITDVAVSAGDTSVAQTTAAELYGLDPSNRATLHQVAEAWRLAGNADSVSHYAALADSVPVDVTVGALAVSTAGAAVSGVVTNPRLVRSGSMVLNIDFLSAAGAVVTGVTEAVPALEAGESTEFALTAVGQGIAGWRYRVRGGAP